MKTTNLLMMLVLVASSLTLTGCFSGDGASPGVSQEVSSGPSGCSPGSGGGC